MKRRKPAYRSGPGVLRGGSPAEPFISTSRSARRRGRSAEGLLQIIEHLLASGVARTAITVAFRRPTGMRRRAFWFLEYFSHPMRPLDGGFSVWTKEVPTTGTAKPQVTNDGRAGPQRLATWHDVKQRLGSRDVTMDTSRMGNAARRCGPPEARGARRRAPQWTKSKR